VGNVRKGRWFDQNFEWKICTGSRFMFWEDTWLGTLPLYIMFPKLYRNSIIKDKPIREFGE